jgi:predicted DNA-binding transcriptional regulator YafY
MAGRPPGTYSQGARLVAQALHLWKGGVIQPSEEAERRGVSRRSVERDLRQLSRAFEEVELRLDTSVGPDGRVVYRFASRDDIKGHRRWQVLAAALGVRLSDFLRGDKFAPDTNALIDSLLHGLGTGHRSDMAATIRSRIHVVRTGRKDYRRRPEVARALHDVLDALLESRVLRLTYHSPTSGKTRQLVTHPLSLVMNRGALYVIVALVERVDRLPERITLAVDRMRHTSVDLESPRQPYPSDFSAKDFLASAFEIYPGPVEHVVIALTGRQAEYAQEHFWHTSARYEPGPDGRVHLHLDVACNVELESWILSMAGAATVLGPPSLRATIRDRLRAGLEAHEAAGD